MSPAGQLSSSAPPGCSVYRNTGKNGRSSSVPNAAGQLMQEEQCGKATGGGGGGGVSRASTPDDHRAAWTTKRAEQKETNPTGAVRADVRTGP